MVVTVLVMVYSCYALYRAYGLTGTWDVTLQVGNDHGQRAHLTCMKRKLCSSMRKFAFHRAMVAAQLPQRKREQGSPAKAMGDNR